MTSIGKLRLRAAAFLAVILAGVPAHASVFQVSTLVALSPTDSLAWVDPEFTAYGPGATFVTPGGVTATLAGASAFTVFSGSTFNADFLPTDSVLSAFDLSFGPVPGPIRINFSSLRDGVGAQIQANSFGPFTGILRAYGVTNNLLDSVMIAGNNFGSGDGSAGFLGLRSTAIDIAAVEFEAGDGLAIGTVALRSAAEVVPEPSTFLLLAAGLGIAGFARRRTRS